MACFMFSSFSELLARLDSRDCQDHKVRVELWARPDRLAMPEWRDLKAILVGFSKALT